MVTNTSIDSSKLWKRFHKKNFDYSSPDTKVSQIEMTPNKTQINLSTKGNSVALNYLSSHLADWDPANYCSTRTNSSEFSMFSKVDESRLDHSSSLKKNLVDLTTRQIRPQTIQSHEKFEYPALTSLWIESVPEWEEEDSIEELRLTLMNLDLDNQIKVSKS